MMAGDGAACGSHVLMISRCPVTVKSWRRVLVTGDMFDRVDVIRLKAL